MTDDLRARLEAAVCAYRHSPDPVHLAELDAAGLDGIARALEVEATALPGIGRDDATARIDGWLTPATPAPVHLRRGDEFGLGGRSPVD